MKNARILLAVMFITAFIPAYGRSLWNIPQSSNSGQASAQQPTKEQVEKLKEERERALKINALITQVNAAMTAKNWNDAIDGLKQLIAIDPTEWELYSSLAVAHRNLGLYQDAID